MPRFGMLAIVMGLFGLVAALVTAQTLGPVGLAMIALFTLVFLLTFVNPEWILHLVILSMLLSPEIALTRVSDTGGHNELTLRAEDFLLMFLGIAWMARVAVYKEIRQVSHSPINAPVAAFLGCCMISTLFGIVAGAVQPLVGGLYLLKYFEYYFIYYMVIMTVDDEKQVRRLLFTFFLTAVITCVIAMAQVPGGGRVTAPFEGQDSGEPNTLGGYLVLTLGVTLGFLSHSRSYWQQVGWTAMCLGLIFPLAYTLSRASWVAVIPVFLGFLVLNYRKRAFLVFLGPVAFVALVLMIAPESLVGRIRGRIDETFVINAGEASTQELFGTPLDASTSQRVQKYGEAIRLAGAHPLLGRGLTGWGITDAWFPRLLVETGALGLVAFLWLLVKVLQGNRAAAHAQRERPDPVVQGLIAGQLLGFLAVMTHAVGADTFLIVRIMEPFWLVTALTFAVSHLRQVPAEVGAEPEPPPSAEMDHDRGTNALAPRSDHFR